MTDKIEKSKIYNSIKIVILPILILLYIWLFLILSSRSSKPAYDRKALKMAFVSFRKLMKFLNVIDLQIIQIKLITSKSWNLTKKILNLKRINVNTPRFYIFNSLNENKFQINLSSYNILSHAVSRIFVNKILSELHQINRKSMILN